jgi:filamentous hemagglutinin family protein
MCHNQSSWRYKLGLCSPLAIIGALALSGDCALAQIIRDNTLGSESSIITPQLINNQPINQIDGGATRAQNLFHSFEQFSVPTGSTAYFNNAANIQNIITRVTGNSISNIDGILRANGTANLFLLNPNGIIFGPNASLNIGGSFVASTASSLNFADGTKFSTTNPQTAPLLTISVPIGLQFGTSPGTIRNQSQASPDGATNSLIRPVGLQVQTGKTLAFVGGDLTFEGGNLTAKGGRIELGSVVANSLVSLNAIDQGWSLGYKDAQDFQNIQIIERNQIPSYVDVSGEGAGNIQVQGRRLSLTGGSMILANTLGSKPGGDLTVNTSESVELIGFLTSLRVRSRSSGNVGNLTVNTGKLIVRDGGQLVVDSTSSGSTGQLTVNASNSVELLGGFNLQFPVSGFVFSGLFSGTSGAGNASDITIKTGKLIVQRGARVSTQSSGFISDSGQFIPATGNGGNLTVNASESVELIGDLATNRASGLLTSTLGPGTAGNLTLTTEQLIVRDGAKISSSSQSPQNSISRNLGKAGELDITARSVLLDNKGSLTSETDSGKGGNITLHVQDLLLLRRQSQISTNAGRAEAGGDGGNITIDASNGFIVADPSENNDITTNAFSGSGGRIKIDTTGIFGFVQRSRADLVRLLQTNDPDKLDPTQLKTSDITAFSQQNPLLSGIIQINTPDVDPSKGLVQLPTNLVDASQQIVTACNPGGKFSRSSLVATGRGGIAPSPTDSLIGDTVIADWIGLGAESDSINHTQNNVVTHPQNSNNVNTNTQIVEAQGWVVDAKGKVHLVAQPPAVILHSPTLTSASCLARHPILDLGF